jgi:cell division protein FtsW
MKKRISIKGDTTLFWLSLITSLIGLVFILDAGYVQSVQMDQGLLARPFITQCILLAVSVGIFFGVRRVSPAIWNKHSRLFMALAVLSLILVEIVGVSQNGARRWLGAGPVLLQPAEFMKVAAIIYLAAALARKKDWQATWETRCKKREWVNRVLVPKLERLWPAFVIFVVWFLIEREKDLGTACVVLSTSVAMFLSAPVTRKSIAIIGAVVVVGLGLFVMKEPYRVQRFVVHPQRWERENINNDSYQTIHSELAMVSGGLVGTGFGSGRAKHMLPATTSDFIMATIAEECGIWGPLICLGLVGSISLRLMQLAKKAKDSFRGQLLNGVAWWLGIQATTNLMMANATIPAIGIPFPFISAGGSSLLAIWMAIGICDRMAIQEEVVTKEVKNANRRNGWRNRRTRLSGA